MADKKIAKCPSCQRIGVFEKAGEQRWPAHIAQAQGVPQVLSLYTCAHCGTTLSEPELLPVPVTLLGAISAARLTVVR